MWFSCQHSTPPPSATPPPASTTSSSATINSLTTQFNSHKAIFNPQGAHSDIIRYVLWIHKLRLKWFTQKSTVLEWNATFLQVGSPGSEHLVRKQRCDDWTYNCQLMQCAKQFNVTGIFSTAFSYKYKAKRFAKQPASGLVKVFKGKIAQFLEFLSASIQNHSNSDFICHWQNVPFSNKIQL